MTQLDLQAKTYLNETLSGVEIVYSGGAVSIKGCSFVKCSITFADAAANTVEFLSAIYRAGGQGPLLVEELFQAIRDGNASQTRRFQ